MQHVFSIFGVICLSNVASQTCIGGNGAICFNLVNSEVSWIESENACSNAGGRLARRQSVGQEQLGQLNDDVWLSDETEVSVPDAYTWIDGTVFTCKCMCMYCRKSKSKLVSHVFLH